MKRVRKFSNKNEICGIDSKQLYSEEQNILFRRKSRSPNHPNRNVSSDVRKLIQVHCERMLGHPASTGRTFYLFCYYYIVLRDKR